jgi:hypothetical protein
VQVERAFDGTEAVEAMAEQLQANPTPGSTPRAFDLVLVDQPLPAPHPYPHPYPYAQP